MLSAMYTGPPHPLLTSDTQELHMRKLQEGGNDMNILGKIWSSVFSILPSSPSTIITIVVVLVSCLSLTLFGSKILKNLLIRLLPFVTKEQPERVKAECMEEIHNLVGNLGELDAKVAEFEVKLEDFGRDITLRIDQVGSKIDELNTTTASLRESLDETNIRLEEVETTRLNEAIENISNRFDQFLVSQDFMVDKLNMIASVVSFRNASSHLWHSGMRRMFPE